MINKLDSYDRRAIFDLTIITLVIWLITTSCSKNEDINLEELKYVVNIRKVDAYYKVIETIGPDNNEYSIQILVPESYRVVLGNNPALDKCSKFRFIEANLEQVKNVQIGYLYKNGKFYNLEKSLDGPEEK